MQPWVKWQYTWNNGSADLVGKEFNVPVNLTGRVDRLSRGPFVQLNANTLQDFALVTGASANHFKEALEAVALVQEFFPSRTLLFYDLGLKPEQVEEVGESRGQGSDVNDVFVLQVKSWCGVEYVRFDFDLYPPHTRNLIIYAFKALIMEVG